MKWSLDLGAGVSLMPRRSTIFANSCRQADKEKMATVTVEKLVNQCRIHDQTDNWGCGRGRTQRALFTLS